MKISAFYEQSNMVSICIFCIIIEIFCTIYRKFITQINKYYSLLSNIDHFLITRNYVSKYS